jgi:hypothetical protein
VHLIIVCLLHVFKQYFTITNKSIKRSYILVIIRVKCTGGLKFVGYVISVR